MSKRSLLLVGALAGCRAVGAPTDRVAPTPELADRASAPLQEDELAVEVVPLQLVSADMLAWLMCPRLGSGGVVRWSENRYCVMELPWNGPVISLTDDAEWTPLVSERERAPPETPWSMDVLAHRNALVIRGTPAQVASLRERVLRLDRRD